MRAGITITDLSLRQWDYLQSNVERAHRFQAGEVRTCVEFQLTPDLNSIHVELPIVDLVGLLYVLQAIEMGAQAEAILTDAEQIVGRVVEDEELVPGAPAVEEDHSACNPRTCTVVEVTEADRMAELASEEHEPTPYRCEHHNPPHLYDCRADQ